MNAVSRFLWIGFGAALLAWPIASIRIYSWPPPPEVELLTFPEALLCLVAFACWGYALRQMTKRHFPKRLWIVLGILGVFLCVTTFLTASKRLNYHFDTQREAAKARVHLDALILEHQKEMQADREAAKNP